eukprot:gene25868-biopygen10989
MFRAVKRNDDGRRSTRMKAPGLSWLGSLDDGGVCSRRSGGLLEHTPPSPTWWWCMFKKDPGGLLEHTRPTDP